VKTHRFDPVSLVFGIVIIVVGIAAINGHAGNLINSRPDALVPLIVLGVGLLALIVATRRMLNARDEAALPDDATP
jgi:tellurite resistance protein TehA-like permease